MLRFRVIRRTLAALPLVVSLAVPAVAQVAPPVAKVVPHTDTIHGDVHVDNYFWLRNRNDPDVVAYLTAENAYTDSMMKGTVALQEKLYQEFLSRIKQTDLSVPERIGDYYYYSRTVEGQQYPIMARKKGSLDAPEEIILDQNEMAKGHRFFDVGLARVSPNQRLFAFTVDTNGSERFTLMVKDLTTGTILPDRIPDLHWSMTWSNDNTIFYTKTDSSLRDDKVFRHVLGTPPSADVMVFHEPDVLFDLAVTLTKDEKYVLMPVNSYGSTEVRYIEAATPLGEWKVLQPRQPGLEYSVDHHDNRFLIVTNAGGATNFKLMTAPEGDPSMKNWTTLVPHRDSVYLGDIDVFKDYLVLYEREKGLQQLRVMPFGAGQPYVIDFPEPVYAVYGGSNREYDSNLLRFSYQSMVTPSSVYDFDMAKRTRELKKQQEVLGGYDPSKYATERVWATATDGVKVPISIVYKKPLVKNGTRPLLLYAYGSYGSSTDPTFNSNNLSLLDRGFIYAIAHIRGGQELGRSWYDQGKLLNKKNTFTDFIASAEHLINEKYTSKDKLAIRGGSAGGLLMGAVVTMRPDLPAAVVADVPFVDVINTMMDASIPLTSGEWKQWGDPHDATYYRYMLSYSPYDNVRAIAYPPMLVTTGLNDTRVAYWEPAKWVAKLRATKTDHNPLILRTNMGAGHGGSSGRYDWLKELAFRYAFILNALGMNEPGSVSAM
jgi:oligopeptidase B